MKKRNLFLMIVISSLLLNGCNNYFSEKPNEPGPVVDVDISSENETTMSGPSSDNDKTESSNEIMANNEIEANNAIDPTNTTGPSENEPPRIICLGDSLTMSYGGDGTTMPGTIDELCNLTVLNYGVYGESLSCMSARYGANPQYLCDDIVIPADETPVQAQVEGKYGWEMLLVFGDAGIHTVSLNGIEGTYTISDEGKRYFTRLTPGEETFVAKGTRLYTEAMLDKQDNDILVLWGGSNDEPQSKDEIPLMLEKIDEIIDYHGNDKYIIVSLTSRHGRIPIVDDVNEAYKERYGEHYLDLRSYMLHDALNDLGITPTELDETALANGDMPYSLRCSTAEDESHGNADFYRLAGEQIYLKLKEIGYIN